jgi:hypothetical protein
MAPERAPVGKRTVSTVGSGWQGLMDLFTPSWGQKYWELGR